jgi:phosphomannomutase
MTTDANIFGVYDIRGRYPKEINEKIVAGISQRLGEYFSLKVVVAHDNRLSSLSLYKTVIKNLKIENCKLKIVDVGLATVPMFYFLVRQQKASGGIMITASHNPKGYNGMKVVDKNALSISGWEIKKLLKS